MFIKYLKIESKQKVIRNFEFHEGLNLIVDNTPFVESEEALTRTGNNVGKTTVLKLIDFCLGGDGKEIYQDEENKKNIDYIIDFLEREEVLITLVLVEDLSETESRSIAIERNFLKRNKKVMNINGEDYKGDNDKRFLRKLDELILGDRTEISPSFREVIAHSIRYSDIRINNTLKYLSNFTTDAEYETLYLYLFGIDRVNRSPLLKQLNSEVEYKKRLERSLTKIDLEFKLDLVDKKIVRYVNERSDHSIDENYEKKLNELNMVRYQINHISSQTSMLSVRREIIIEAIEDLRQQSADIDMHQLRAIYEQASKMINNIQKTFEDLVEYHNAMIIEKVRFISDDIPELEDKLSDLNRQLQYYLMKEKELTDDIRKSDTSKALEELIKVTNEAYREKGELENAIQKIEEVEGRIKDFENKLNSIDESHFSEKSKQRLKEQLKKFNVYFAEAAKTLYDEEYAITFQKKINQRTKKPVYEFTSFNANNSSGKKQGEILCFDLAFIQFAEAENLPILNFILNDKKELLHGNQIINLKNYIEGKNIQVILSILSDKLPKELKKKEFIVVELSQEEKLFKIENSQK